MADLFDRLFVVQTNKIPVHAFIAAITDYIAGETTKNQIINVWELDAEAQADLNAMCTNIDGLSSKAEKIIHALEIDSTMLLCEAGLKYMTKSALKTRLGL